jgi:hypothetical protein
LIWFPILHARKRGTSVIDLDVRAVGSHTARIRMHVMAAPGFIWGEFSVRRRASICIEPPLNASFCHPEYSEKTPEKNATHMIIILIHEPSNIAFQTEVFLYLLRTNLLFGEAVELPYLGFVSQVRIGVERDCVRVVHFVLWGICFENGELCGACSLF